MKVFCTVLSTASATSTTIQKLTPGFTAIFSSSPSLNFSSMPVMQLHMHLTSLCFDNSSSSCLRLTAIIRSAISSCLLIVLHRTRMETTEKLFDMSGTTKALKACSIVFDVRRLVGLKSAIIYTRM